MMQEAADHCSSELESLVLARLTRHPKTILSITYAKAELTVDRIEGVEDGRLDRGARRHFW